MNEWMNGWVMLSPPISIFNGKSVFLFRAKTFLDRSLLQSIGFGPHWLHVQPRWRIHQFESFFPHLPSSLLFSSKPQTFPRFLPLASPCFFHQPPSPITPIYITLSCVFPMFFFPTKDPRSSLFYTYLPSLFSVFSRPLTEPDNIFGCLLAKYLEFGAYLPTNITFDKKEASCVQNKISAH